MSKIGRLPIEIPKGVEIKIDGNNIQVKGPKGMLSIVINPMIKIEMKDGKIILSRKADDRKTNSLYGLSRTLVSNMVKGVTEGFTKDLELTGVGYRAAAQGKNLSLQLGYSHQITINPPEGIQFKIQGQNKITVIGIDKEVVGQVAANIKACRPVEPYKGKGIKYAGETVRRKAGKAAASAKGGA
jgi:large subunit ribosomal protein L6